MAGSGKAAEIRAGIVVLIGIAILGVGLFFVSGGWGRFEQKARYTIHFKDAGTIGGGADVYRAGVKVGEVYKLETDRVTIKGEVYSVSVTIEVWKGTEIPIDSSFQISKSITNVVAFNIRPGKETKLATESDENLVGERLATTDELVDRYTKLADYVFGVVDHVDKLVLDLNAKLKDIDVGALQAEARQLLADLRAAAVELQTLIHDNSGRISHMIENIDEITTNVRGDWTTISKKLDGILDNTNEATGELKGILKENRERIKSVFKQLDDGMARLAPALAQIESIARAANDAVVELRPGLSRTITAASKAFANFEAVTEDLRSAPWKLVNKPSDKESDDVHLYNAARCYVAAAGDLAAAIQDMETLRRLGVLGDPQRTDLVEKALTTMQEALANFEANQKTFSSLIAATSDGKK